MRKPLPKTSATHAGQTGKVDVDQIDIRPDIKHLVVVKVPADIEPEMMARAQKQMAKTVGPENLVIVVPQGVDIEVIALEGISEEDKQARRANADWNW